MKRFPLFAHAITLTAALTFAGCGGTTSSDKSDDHAPGGPGHSEDDGHDHGHAEEGPHHGHLIELGEEEYHAELTHDDATGAITVYLLGKDAKSPVEIDAAEITLNLTAADGPMQVALAADPQDSDAEGQSSRFSATDAAALEALEAEETKGRLNVTIGGKSYAGTVEHHSHGEHEHEEHNDN